jgi:hypothetical protein
MSKSFCNVRDRVARQPPPQFCALQRKILQGGRSRSQGKVSPVGRVEPEAVFEHFKLTLALLSFEMPFWQPGTSKELDLEQKVTWPNLGKAPRIGF